MAKRCPDFAQILRTTPPTAAVREQVAICFSEEMGRAARRRCRNDSLSEDAAQDAMMHGLTSLDSYRGEGPLDAWLRKLVVTACSRLRRGRANDPSYRSSLGELPSQSAAREATQEVTVLLNQRIEILGEVLGEVEEPNRSLFLLHEGDEVSLAELAERFELTVDGVKARLKRTRARLRERLLAIAESEV